jgi:hypothetical protein
MDIRTLYLTSGLLTVLLTLGISCLALSRPKARYVVFWAAANLFYTFASLGIALRGIIPEWLSLVAGNPANLLAVYMWLEGFQALTGSRRFTLPSVVLVAASSLDR